MIGSLNKVWPWKITLDTVVDRHGETIPLAQKSVLPSNFDGETHLTMAIVWSIVGLLAIVILERYSSKKKAS